MSWPDAQVDVTVDLVRSLLVEQHPQWARLDITEVDFGFDNSIWRVGESLVARLPRREVAVGLIENELRWLPELAAHLTLRIPEPVARGEANERYPWTWSIARWIDGTPGDRLDDAELAACAGDLGAFHASLHVPAPDDAPRNALRGVALHAMAEAFERRLGELGSSVDRVAIDEVFRVATNAPPWPLAPRWLHGDPHPANLIFERGRLAGVIDFGDLCQGDPATDLAGGLMTLPYDQLARYFDAYGDVDTATRARTIGWTLHMGVMFVLLGRRGRVSYARIGERALANALRSADDL